MYMLRLRSLYPPYMLLNSMVIDFRVLLISQVCNSMSQARSHTAFPSATGFVLADGAYVIEPARSSVLRAQYDPRS